MKRIFLGWHKPLLELTADFLIERHTDTNGLLNLKGVTVVMSGTRACNRLEEILATRAAEMKNKAWYPPEFLTLELLPEKFYKLKKPLASDLVRCVAWMKSIDRLDMEAPELRKRILPMMPANFEARLALGRMLARLHYDLASEGRDFIDVAKACRELNAKDEIPRWNALARLQKMYANDDPKGYLDERGLWDIQAARLFAIEQQQPEEREKIRAALQRENRRFYLVGLVDMNKLQKRILKNFDSFLMPLVFAPDDPPMKNRFDEFGCLITEKWCEAPIEIDEKIINIVSKPQHQADVVLREIAALGNNYSSGQIIIGVPDKQVVPFLQQRFAQADLPSRLLEGTSIKQTGIYRFLEVFLQFLKTNHYRDYAELIRHPDIEQFLRHKINFAGHLNIIKLLDDYHKTCLPVFVPEQWNTGGEKLDTSREFFMESRKEVEQLLGISKQTSVHRSFAGWLAVLKSVLNTLYQGNREDIPTDAVEVVLRNLESLQSQTQEISEQFSFAEALKIFLAQIESESIPPGELSGAIEMIGWLETAMDDAPVALITGMNEGKIPSSTGADMFLPDELRKALGLMDNRRRSARDAYYLNVLLETRKEAGKVALIAGRISTEGDPMLPSRFFFSSQDTRKVSERVRQFFGVPPSEKLVRLAASLRPGCTGKHHFTAPALPPLSEPIRRISVTSVKDYKACAYRFYLKHVLGLKKINDENTELAYNDFGTLIHLILRNFGEKNNPVRHSASAEEIERFLNGRLAEHVRERYGKTPMSTVEIQVERAKARLAAFAKLQASRRQAGYEIADVEFKLDDMDTPIMISGIQLRGQIDRIDRRGKELIVLDYKTSDGSPEEKHRHKERDWIDFQLPLYHYILRESGYAESGDDIRLGYMTISKNIHSIRANMVEWSDSEVQSGISEAKRLITELSTRDWSSVLPVSPAPEYSEDLEFICHDGIS